ncbi:putative ADP-ribosylation factor GTPase-activating protein AGD11 [Morus notabilis]|uniref:Putative ADP-ribosylation factor GTPase-activating protein AGD11 n=1 Tax=Morus notabilis TaxID=981085 RepID=W9S175_9ROSA|nr:protein C2-DOMAIN ABA-RELATED 5 [Morus notabilis]EXC20653.1 putative ADP-ribosylation factor GTPase-activating protein AGD11 [Morus notabilis]
MVLLKMHIQRGVNLAVRDIVTSDPYVVLKLGNQKLKTRVIKGNVNPEWNQSFNISVSDSHVPIHLCVYDKDTFSFDDKMGDADIDVAPFLKASKMHLKGVPDGITLSKVQPTKQNCLTEESCIVWSGGRIVQNMILRLQNVECGEVELQLSA